MQSRSETDERTNAESRPKTFHRKLGWAEIVAAPVLISWATVWHARHDSGSSAAVWLWSFPVAILFLLGPGVLLFARHPARWLAQILPATFAVWLAFVVFNA